jgi:hypothetical protein
LIFFSYFKVRNVQKSGNIMIPAISSLLSPASTISGISKALGVNPLEEISSSSSSVSSPDKMMSSILQSLSQLPSKSPEVASNTSNASVNNFVQSLVDAIATQQNAGESSPQTPAIKAFNNQNSFESGLQSLLDQLNENKKQSAQPAMEQLSQQADQLFASIGAQTGPQALGQFLGNLQQSFAGTNPVGSIVSIKA